MLPIVFDDDDGGHTGPGESDFISASDECVRFMSRNKWERKANVILSS